MTSIMTQFPITWTTVPTILRSSLQTSGSCCWSVEKERALEIVVVYNVIVLDEIVDGKLIDLGGGKIGLKSALDIS